MYSMPFHVVTFFVAPVRVMFIFAYRVSNRGILYVSELGNSAKEKALIEVLMFLSCPAIASVYVENLAIKNLYFKRLTFNLKCTPLF